VQGWNPCILSQIIRVTSFTEFKGAVTLGDRILGWIPLGLIHPIELPKHPLGYLSYEYSFSLARISSKNSILEKQSGHSISLMKTLSFEQETTLLFQKTTKNFVRSSVQGLQKLADDTLSRVPLHYHILKKVLV
jgi:hypothetical protein